MVCPYCGSLGCFQPFERATGDQVRNEENGSRLSHRANSGDSFCIGLFLTGKSGKFTFILCLSDLADRCLFSGRVHAW